MSDRKARWIFLVLFCSGILFVSGIAGLHSTKAATGDRIDYNVVEKSDSIIHTITIPHNSSYSVVPVVSGKLQPLADFAIDNQDVVAAINGGYFDPINHKTTSFIIEQSEIVGDPRFNERLVDNPDLKPYLGKIFNRTEFRRYSCGDRMQYDIQLHSAPIPFNCTLKGSLGGGPGLLPQNTSEAEAFTAYQDGQKIRDAIGTDSLNARSAVGITKAGDVILVMAAQLPHKPLNSGVSLAELTDFLSELGAVKAMNLDGGSSASLYYGDCKASRRHRVIYGRVDRESKAIQRPIKSVLLVKKK